MAAFTGTAKLTRPLSDAIVRAFDAYEAMSPGQAVYLRSDGQVALADADVADSAQVIGIVGSVVNGKTSAAAGDRVDVVMFGAVCGFSSLTVGGLVYASVTAGSMDQTRPAGSSGDYVFIVGTAIAADTIFVNPFTDSFAAA